VTTRKRTANAEVGGSSKKSKKEDTIHLPSDDEMVGT
ncbi:hypothetical protein A2U01_0108402, partial [Trifolium medium]|nr:hypothetical protein [Trifolium medium]